MVWQALAANVAGSVASAGISKLFGGKQKRGPDAGDQRVDHYYNVKNNLKAIMDGAKENGIHPLYAMGAPTAPGTVYQVGGDNNQSAIANEMGQNIGAAISRAGNKSEREYAAATAAIALERGELENELLKSQIAQIRASHVPAAGIGSEILAGQSDAVEKVPSIQTMHGRSAPTGEGGAITDVGYAHVTPSRLQVVPSADMKNRMEDDFIQQLKWHGRHSVPLWSDMQHLPYPDVPLPKGAKRWVRVPGGWQASRW